MLYYGYNHLQYARVLCMHRVSHIALCVYVCVCHTVVNLHILHGTFCLCNVVFSFLLMPVVPAQPTRFEAEAELDTRIMLTWLWPVQDQNIIKYELQYWEAGTDNKVRIPTWAF